MTRDFQRARENWDDATDASSEQRTRMVEDLRFSNPADPDQWEDAVKKARTGDAGGARPTFVFDQTNQYIAQVVNDSRMNKPQIQTIPASSGANEKVSEALDGIIRHIEYRSSAAIAYDTAQEHAARVGMGWMRVLPVPIEDPDTENAQEIRIARIHDPLSVKYDPNFTMPDGSDQTFGFVETTMTLAMFEAKYGKKRRPANWNEDKTGWWDTNSVRIAEYFEVKEVQESRLWIDDPDNAHLAEGKTSVEEKEYWGIRDKTGVRLKTSGQFWKKSKSVKWWKMDGNDFLEEGTDFPSQYIPLIPVMGYEVWIEGKRYLCGMVRRMMPGQRAYNMERNAELEWMAKQPKAPYIVAWESVSEHQKEWGAANVTDAAYLPYDHVDGENNPLPPPQRLAPPNAGAAFQNLGQKGLSDLQASIGMYRANLGAPSNETSGIAIKRREQQGDTANFHYIDNLSRSMAHLGRIIVDMIPKVYDTKRAARILGLDGKSEQVIINPSLKEPVVMKGKKVVEINLNTGVYETRCKVGPAYASLREEAAAGMENIIRAFPAYAPILGPMWARMQDWPESEKASKLMLALAPPQVQAIESDEEEIPPQVQAQMAQMKQQMDEAQAHIKQLSDALVNAADQHQAAEAAQRDKDEDQRINAYKAATDRLKLVMPLMTPIEVAGVAEEAFQAAGIDLPGGLPPLQPPPMAANPNQPPPMAAQQGPSGPSFLPA